MMNRSTRLLTSGVMTKRLTEIAHALIAEVAAPGDCVIDATMGNGYDTLFLAQHVGHRGHVYALDIQQQALEQTAARLLQEEVRRHVTLIRGNHARMLDLLPGSMHGKASAVVFNLGYLPGGEKSITTSAESTLGALDAALELLRPGGIISLLVYVGHAGGEEEHRAILHWLEEVRRRVRWKHHNPHSDGCSPRLYSIIKA
jgi:predicted methyltransferase